MSIQSVWRRIKDAFKGNERFKPGIIGESISDALPKIKHPGRGEYFKNNRRRTRGRNIQYVSMPNGKTKKVIKHETL